MSSTAETSFTDCRQRLIQAATEAFMTEGYRATINRIAVRAGVARQTVYNHFASKEDLFNEVARIAAADILITLEDGNRSLRDSLLRFGIAYCAKALRPEGLAHYRLIIAEATRFPDLARTFFTLGPQQMASRLAGFIAAAIDAGELHRTDPAMAADLLIGMLSGFERTRRLLAPQEPATLAQEQTRAAEAIDCFLRAYAPERTPS